MNFEDAKRSGARWWSEDTGWSDRTANKDYDAFPDYLRLTAMFEKLMMATQFDRVVEIGCGDARYSEYLQKRQERALEWVATDFAGPRIERAKREVPSIRVEAADILECQERYNRPGTLFLAANVFGNVTPPDMALFFERLTIPGSGLVFLAGGLTLLKDDLFIARPSGTAFDHSFIPLIKRSMLTDIEYIVDYLGGGHNRAGFWVSGRVLT